MNRQERKQIQEATMELVANVLEISDEQSLKEFCERTIREIIEEQTDEAVNETLAETKKYSATAQTYANKAVAATRATKDFPAEAEYLIARCGVAVKEMSEVIGRYESTKRAANRITNNAVIDGFQCSECGCICKNVNIGGSWVKNVRFCPNCGGENINYKE